jgi:hypothetical protein
MVLPRPKRFNPILSHNGSRTNIVAVGGTIVWDLAFLVEGQVTVKRLMSVLARSFR